MTAPKRFHVLFRCCDLKTEMCYITVFVADVHSAPQEVRRSSSNLWCDCNEECSPGSRVTQSSLSLIDRAAPCFPVILSS